MHNDDKQLDEILMGITHALSGRFPLPDPEDAGAEIADIIDARKEAAAKLKAWRAKTVREAFQQQSTELWKWLLFNDSYLSRISNPSKFSEFGDDMLTINRSRPKGTLTVTIRVSALMENMFKENEK